MERVEFSASFEIAGSKLGGTAHVFGERTVRNGEPLEFSPKAFDRSLRDKAVTAFYSHDMAKPLASMATGKLRAGVVQAGGRFRLDFEMDLGSQTYAEDLRANTADGLMGGMSFGVVYQESKPYRAQDGTLVRLHTESHLYDISPVAVPQFGGTVARLYAAEMAGSREERLRAIARAGGLRA